MASLSFRKPIVAFFVPLATGEIAPLPNAQGNEGRLVESNAIAAFEHINDRPGRLIEDESDDDPFEYNPVPMKYAFTVKVKYRFVDPMKPLPYPLED